MFIAIGATKNEITPFYVWAMYSTPIPEDDSFSIYTFEYNDGQVFQEVHTWNDYYEMMFPYTISHYMAIKDNGGEPNRIRMTSAFNQVGIDTSFLDNIYNTNADIVEYPYWLKRYMQEHLNEQLNSFSVYRKWLQYNEEGRVHVVKNELIFRR